MNTLDPSTDFNTRIARAHRAQALASRLYAFAYGLEPRESAQRLADTYLESALAYDQMAEAAEARSTRTEVAA